MLDQSRVTLRSVVSSVIAVCAAAIVTSGTLVAGAASGADSLARLKTGNARFVASPREPLPIDAAQADGPTPFATVLSCADARAPRKWCFTPGSASCTSSARSAT